MSKPPTDLAPVLMLQGTGSSVGKSLLTAGFCRYFSDKGLRVAPFKAQNMALNSYVTPEGLEIGRAQAMQAWAARTQPHVDMNPVLLKPEGNARSQIVLFGKPAVRLEAHAYEQYKEQLRANVLAALERLRQQYDVVVIEGAGSPAEVNLRSADIVNMFVARSVQAPVLLVADIDKGGVFASLVGTLELLEPEERDLVAGFLINKFRGDKSLLQDGLDFLEDRTGKPVFGVLDYLYDLALADEDSHLLEISTAADTGDSQYQVAVVRYPRASNLDDFLALQFEDDIAVHFVDQVVPEARFDAILLPGSKTTAADLQWLRARGFDRWLQSQAAADVPLIGICGGYQILGQQILDPDAVESVQAECQGLGLLPITTRFRTDKTTLQTRFTVSEQSRVLPGLTDKDICHGYEIHMADIQAASGLQPFAMLDGHQQQDGCESANVLGTFMHGLFDNDAVRSALRRRMQQLRHKQQRPLPTASTTGTFQQRREGDMDRVAMSIASQVDVQAIETLLFGAPL